MEHPGQAIRGSDALDPVVVSQHRRQVDEPAAHADGEHQTRDQDGLVAVAERHRQHYAASQQLTEIRHKRCRSHKHWTQFYCVAATTVHVCICCRPYETSGRSQKASPVYLPWVENCQNARGCFSIGDCSVHSLATNFSCSYHGFTLVSHRRISSHRIFVGSWYYEVFYEVFL